MNIYPADSVAILIQGMLETLGIASQLDANSEVNVVSKGEVPPGVFFGGSLPHGYSLESSL
jgi:hypothetical protein